MASSRRRTDKPVSAFYSLTQGLHTCSILISVAILIEAAYGAFINVSFQSQLYPHTIQRCYTALQIFTLRLHKY